MPLAAPCACAEAASAGIGHRTLLPSAAPRTHSESPLTASRARGGSSDSDALTTKTAACLYNVCTLTVRMPMLSMQMRVWKPKRRRSCACSCACRCACRYEARQRAAHACAYRGTAREERGEGCNGCEEDKKRPRASKCILSASPPTRRDHAGGGGRLGSADGGAGAGGGGGTDGGGHPHPDAVGI